LLKRVNNSIDRPVVVQL